MATTNDTDTDDGIAVVKPYYAIEEAYRDGYDRFADMEDLGDDEPLDLAPFKSSAMWADHIAPRLRAMAGMQDAGHGTYQTNRKVAAIKPGCEEDEPAEAELIEARRVHEILVEAWDHGALDAADGVDSSPEHLGLWS